MWQLLLTLKNCTPLSFLSFHLSPPPSLHLFPSLGWWKATYLHRFEISPQFCLQPSEHEQRASGIMCLRVEDAYRLGRGENREETSEWSHANNSWSTSQSKKTFTPSVVFIDKIRKKKKSTQYWYLSLESHQLILEGHPNLQYSSDITWFEMLRN